MCSVSKNMTLSIPTETEIMELATFLRSLQTNHFDNENITENDNIPENDSFTENEHYCDISSLVAFEDIGADLVLKYTFMLPKIFLMFAFYGLPWTSYA